MALKREDLIKTLVRKELDFYVAGHSLRDRMANLLDEVEVFTDRWIAERQAEGDKGILTHRIYGDGLANMSRADIIAHLMEMDTDNVVKGQSLKNRMYDLQSVAFGWIHDQRVVVVA